MASSVVLALVCVYYDFRGALGNNYNRYQTFASDEASGLSYYDGAENVDPTLHNFKAETGRSTRPTTWHSTTWPRPPTRKAHDE